MNKTNACILKGQKLLAEDVTVQYLEQVDSAGMQFWDGNFEIEPLPEELFNGNGPFEIEMSDGRSGQFLVKNIELAATPTIVSIVSTGPLD